MKTGIELFTEERQKQISKHGFTGEHHALHPEWYDENQLVQASQYLSLQNLNHSSWHPKNWDSEWFKNLCYRPYRERLAISGALLAAELDRLNKLESNQ